MAISLITGPQDPSQLDAVINGVIVQVNNQFSGQTASVSVSAQSTLSALSGYGAVTVNTTTRTAGTTGRYSIAAPVSGRVMTISSQSTVPATITGLFNRGRTKVTLKTTAALTAGAKLPSVILRGLSTSAWAVAASFGNVATT
jgi:hypothetical protein